MPKRVNVELNITLRCNMRCMNCNRLCHLYPNGDVCPDIRVYQVAEMLEQVAQSDVKIKRVKIVGGEPVLHPDLPEILGLLAEGIDAGLLQWVRIDSNGMLPRPDHVQTTLIKWGGKSTRRKRHMPPLWSPKDLGYKVDGSLCKMVRRCGPSLDARGWLPCSQAVAMVFLTGWYHLYQTTFPGDLVWAREELCPHCPFAMPQQWQLEHSYPLAETPPEAKVPTPFWDKLMRDRKRQ